MQKTGDRPNKAASGFTRREVVAATFAGEEVQPRLHARVMLPEGVLKDIAAQDEYAITIVPVGIDVPSPDLKGPKGPEVRVDFAKLALSVGEKHGRRGHPGV